MKNNRLRAISKYYTIGLATLPAAAGSAVSFMFVFAAFAGIYDVLKKHISLKLNIHDRIIVYPAMAYFIVNALSIIRLDFQMSDILSLSQSLLFLLPFFVIKRYRYIGGENQFEIFRNAVPYGALLLLPWIFYEGFYLNMRMSGGAGNAIPFGMICALMAPICLINLVSKNRSYQLLSIIGFVIFSVALAFSQSRSMYIAFVPNILIALGYLVYTSKQKIRTVIIGILVLISISIFALNSTTVAERFKQLADPFTSVLSGTEIKDESVGHRYSLLKKGLCFAQNNPIIGYGISNRDEILTSTEIQESDVFDFCNKSQDVFYYSHFHNGFLTSFIDVGIFGLLSTLALLFAPIVLALFSPSDGRKILRISIALCLTSVYLMAGLTNLLFGHDLIDSMFLIFACFLALSIDEHEAVTIAE